MKTRKYAKRPALFDKKGEKWVGQKYHEVRKKVIDLGSGLASLGVEKNDKVAILSRNNSIWALADYAIASLGAVSVTVYPSLVANQIKYILEHSESKIVIVENSIQGEKILSIRKTLPLLESIITMEEVSENDDNILRFSDILKGGREYRKKNGFDLEKLAMAVKPDDTLTLVYTSGTTGVPKGVQLSHGNLVANVMAGKKVITVTQRDKFLSFLPLSHIFERMVGHYIPFSSGSSIYYAENLEKIGQNLQEVQPTIMAAIPRLFEKMKGKINENVQNGPGIKRALFNWAMKRGYGSINSLCQREYPGGWKGIQYKIAQKLVFSKLKQKVGGELRFFASGGAALPKDVGEFFMAADIPIIEGYGLTETSPIISANTDKFIKFGTVGPPFPGVKVKIASDGEILCKGKNVMSGYYKDAESTKEVLDGDGWFHTGDIGHLDGDGCLCITDRKKNLIVTSYGKNVVPVVVENNISKSKYVDQCMVLGNQKKFVSAVIVPSFPALRLYLERKGKKIEDKEEIIKDRDVLELFNRTIEKNMAELANFERVKKFILVSEEWTIENDLLTPTLKVKKNKIFAKYHREIEELYS